MRPGRTGGLLNKAASWLQEGYKLDKNVPKSAIKFLDVEILEKAAGELRQATEKVLSC